MFSGVKSIMVVSIGFWVKEIPQKRRHIVGLSLFNRYGSRNYLYKNAQQRKEGHDKRDCNHDPPLT